jgi:preprotein translocase subunit SecA
MSDSLLGAVPLQLPSLRLQPVNSDTDYGWEQRLSGAIGAATDTIIGPLVAYQRQGFVRKVNALRGSLLELDETQFKDFVTKLRDDLICEGLKQANIVRAYAVIKEAARREIEQEHYDVQLQGGYALLHGAIAELETGEGKTLTATLAAATAAMAGTPVHVITVNDYLAQRDEELMRPVYRALGLTVGLVVSGMSQEERRDAYRADITYCTNKEVAFDYLRDGLLLGKAASNVRMKISKLHGEKGQSSEQPVMRGLHFAIVDEADSVLIDEARTPLIISGSTDPDTERKRAQQALDLATPLLRDEHFTLRRDGQEIVLTDKGKTELMDRGNAMGGLWRGSIFREEQARNALGALHIYKCEEHYLVRDDKIEIIDEYTGRVMPDRSWGDGIHQLVELKEGCTITGQTISIARITYQRFFRCYRKLGGMTGTASEARTELRSVYGLAVERINTNRPLARSYADEQIYSTSEQKWVHIVNLTRDLVKKGIPVLIATRSVASSTIGSEHLTDAGIEHRVLSAVEDHHEADIIAAAGQSGCVTVATNMAGRGVDIRLGDGVVELGGLHVIVSDRHDSSRIDRQLAGRCARQGQPGHVETVLSLEDTLIVDSGVLLPYLSDARWYRKWLFNRAQSLMERKFRRARRDLMNWDQQLGSSLAFSGSIE